VSLTELNCPLHMVTPLGLAEAHFILLAGQDGIEWGCFQKDTGEFWVWPNKQVRLCTSITEYRYKNSGIYESPECTDSLMPHRERAMKLKRKQRK
jgi:hypothetical protein